MKKTNLPVDLSGEILDCDIWMAECNDDGGVSDKVKKNKKQKGVGGRRQGETE